MTPTTAGRANCPTPPATAARRWRLAVAYLTTVTLAGWAVLGTYALAAVGFLVGVAAFLAGSVWLIDRAATRSCDRHVARALDDNVRPLHYAPRRLG